MSPWRHNPPVSLDDARAISRLSSVAWVAVDEGGQADITFGDKVQHSVHIDGRSAAWPNVAGGDISPGPSFTEVEDPAARPGGVINPKPAGRLFDPVGPPGRRIPPAALPHPH